ncbi:MAG: pyridoxal-phosphate dependent enzyme [Bacteroidetes bacterium]|nr:pyridoxal-phosphate dependent enzyme [Bacteroidota bacterium]
MDENSHHSESGNNFNIDKPYDLIDGAKSSGFEIIKDLEERKKIIADTSLSIEERFEAFEDVIESEIGDTSLVRARNIERETGLRQLYLKFEGSNPSGTQKDRIAFAQAADAMRRGFDTITLATCGNYGVACALAASIAGLKCHIFIPDTYHTVRIQEMIDLGATIERVNGDYEFSVQYSSEYALKHELYDANPGGQNIILQLKAYGEIAYEIYDDLRDAPSIVAVPVSNGTTVAGIYRGFLSLYRRGKTSRMPKFVVGSSFRKNPITRALELNKDTCEDLVPKKIKETKVNEALINWHSIDGDFALEAVRNTNGWGSEATDKMMISASKMLREKEGILAMPASTAGLIALLNKHKEENFVSARYVTILTGRK